MPSTAVRDAAIVLGVVSLDLATKAAVLALLPLGVSIDLWGEYVRLTSVRNVGAAFGLLAGAPWAGLLFTAVTAAAIAGLLLYRRRVPPEATAQRLGLHLVLGGAAGNLVDRLRFGHVVDFVDVGLGAWRWPAFNVADSAITIGVAILLLAPSGRRAPAAAPDRGA